MTCEISKEEIGFAICELSESYLCTRCHLKRHIVDTKVWKEHAEFADLNSVSNKVFIIANKKLEGYYE